MTAENVQNSVDKPNTSTPMREEQVQNAVKFLSHPKVRGSPVILRRSFLEKKGLTKEEIDEAFRRVPDSSPAAVGSNGSQDGQVKSPSNHKLQDSTLTLHPSATAPTASTTVVSALGTLKWPEFHWFCVILAVGLLSISSAVTTLIIKNKMIPRLKSWIRNVLKDGDEATFQEMRKTEDIVCVLNLQLQEMKSLRSAILSLQGDSVRTSSSKRASATEGHHQVDLTVQKQLYAKDEMDSAFSTVKSPSPQTQVKSSTMPHSNASMEDSDFDEYFDYDKHLKDFLILNNRIIGEVPNGLVCDGPSTEERNLQTIDSDFDKHLKDFLILYPPSNFGTHEQPITRPRVPPEAIRRSKLTVQTETLAKNPLITAPNRASELQEIQNVETAGEGGLLEESLERLLDSKHIQEL